MKTALITGASDGIGLELARILARNGHRLILVARRLDRLHKLREELQLIGPIEVHCMGLDLSVHDAAADLYQQIQLLGWTVDFLINNAGVGVYGAFAESDWGKTAAMIDLNIRSLTQLTHLFLPAMIAQGMWRRPPLFSRARACRFISPQRHSFCIFLKRCTTRTAAKVFGLRPSVRALPEADLPKPWSHPDSQYRVF